MKRLLKAGCLIVALAVVSGCTIKENITVTESSYASEDKKSEVSDESDYDNKAETDYNSETSENPKESSSADEAEKFIDGYAVLSKSSEISLDDTSLTKVNVSEGSFGNVLGTYDGMLYIEWIQDIYSDSFAVCRAPIASGGEAEVLFEVEPYETSYNIGMLNGKFYYLYVSVTEEFKADTKLYEYNIDGSYNTIDLGILPYVPHYWTAGNFVILNIMLENRCRLVKYDTTTGEKSVIAETEIVHNEDGTSTGEMILDGGALDDNGFCYEISYMENDTLDTANSHSVFYYDFETGTSSYMYSPQGWSAFVRGDKNFVIRTENKYEKPLKNPTTFYDAASGEWGRIGIFGVSIGYSIKDIYEVDDFNYIMSNRRSVYELDVKERSITEHKINVVDIPDNWKIEGIDDSYLVNVYLADDDTACIVCNQVCVIVKLSDLEKDELIL